MKMSYAGIVSHDQPGKLIVQDEMETIKKLLEQGYTSPYAALLTPSDSDALASVVRVTQQLQALRPTLLLLIGIGGSNMGTLAITQALLGSFYNDTCPELNFYCADTIDNDMQEMLLKRIEGELLQSGTVLLCLVTKSGTTTESLINGSLFIELLKKHRPLDYDKYVVCISDADSPLRGVAQKKGFTFLEIPKNVGGRFSVFSTVGLLPLTVLGIDTDALCKGAYDMLTESLHQKEKSAAAQSALMLNSYYQKGYDIHALFVFSPDLLMLGNWYKQLIGESLGKKFDRKGNAIEAGMTPLVSVGTTDLHSVAQLYLAGPRTTITTFIDCERENTILTVPVNEVSEITHGLAGKSVTSIKKAIFQGVTEAYADEQRPFMVCTLEEKNAYQLGQFMMMKMIETLLLARLWNINPFDQPAVELYKSRAQDLMNR